MIRDRYVIRKQREAQLQLIADIQEGERDNKEAGHKWSRSDFMKVLEETKDDIEQSLLVDREQEKCSGKTGYIDGIHAHRHVPALEIAKLPVEFNPECQVLTPDGSIFHIVCRRCRSMLPVKDYGHYFNA